MEARPAVLPGEPNVILGNVTSAGLLPHHLAGILFDLPEKSYWSLGGIGSTQLRANIAGIAPGGGVRVGIEDNIWLDRAKTRPATNEQLVDRIVTILSLTENTLMSPDRFRRIMEM
jgi:3-keto-5-aminohexanoate cleavage enzyme